MRVIRSFLLGCLVFVVCTSIVQAEIKEEAVPVIEIVEPVYDFGEIKKRDLIKHDYKVLNKGTEPLEIKTVEPD